MSRKSKKEYFKPLTDEDNKEVKYVSATQQQIFLAQKSKQREKNCVKLERISPEDSRNLYYLRSFLRKAIHCQSQVLHLKQKKIEYKYMHILSDLLSRLCLFLFDMEEEENLQIGEQDFEGREINQQRQMLVRDTGVLDTLINLLHFPIRIRKAYDRSIDMILTLRGIIGTGYKALRLSIMEYRPNELYASQWLGLLIEDVFNDHSKVIEESSKTLKELYDNNQRVLETRIDMDTIFKFVFFLAEVHFGNARTNRSSTSTSSKR